MFGSHPKTGKPIRILETETSVWKNKKTIAWPPEYASFKLNRWDTGIIGARRLIPNTDVLVLCQSAEEATDLAWLRTGAWRTVKMIVASKKLLELVGDEEMKRLGIANVICLDEIHELYPFTGAPWDGTANDAAILASLLLRMGVVYGLDPTERVGLKVHQEIPQPPQLWFITQYYRPTQARRAREVYTALRRNAECKYIDRIVLLNEMDMTAAFPPEKEKIRQEVIGKRLTYALVIQWIKENAPPNTICVFANSDIYLDDTWKAVWATSLEDKFLSLLRYEVDESKPDEEHELFGPRSDSQDTWVVFSNSVRSRTWDYSALDFPFGKAGCDNAINVEMLRAKFLVSNPSLTLKTHHLHTSQIRNYDPQDIVDKSMYFYVKPTGLHDMNPLVSLTPSKTIISASFPRPVKGLTPVKAATFCNMLTRKEVFDLKPDSLNTFVADGPLKIYEASNVFQTHTGLAYTYDSIYVGKSQKATEAWNKSEISGLAPSLPTPLGLVAPLPDEYVENNAVYVLKYIANILLLREEAGGGEFWSPRGKPFLDSLQLFNWKRKEVPVIPREEGIQVFCEKVYMMLPQDSTLIRKEQVQALRRNLMTRTGGVLGPWTETSDAKRCVVFIDEDVCTREFVKQLEATTEYPIETIWSGMTSLETVLIKLTGASAVILASGQNGITRWGWSWILPRGAKVIEIQNEMDPEGECLQLSAAAELTHRLCITPKGKLTEKGTKTLVQSIVTHLQEEEAPPQVKRPILLLPKKPSESFFGHANDSFREMAFLWEERGYVTVEQDSNAHQVWLNGIGNILLYDRPTYEWLNQSPPEEKKFRMALVGNPAPMDSSMKAWSFWPRRPRLVEELAKIQRPFEERTQALVFYGRIENAVQKKRRTDVAWPTACSECVMPLGSDGYVYSQKEYLEKLSIARFGLCLPGYGWKCHREVECMAMGCVPIVTPQVDMKFYANPPVEGVHYFVADTPEKARALSVETTEEQWKVMSSSCILWWKENASCDGMWVLTQKLTSL